MNKLYQYVSDYRLPTEKPFKEAVRLYWQRVLIIGAVALSAMVASALIALIIIAFQAGYGWIVIIVVVLLLLGGGGTSGGGQTPPPSNTTKTQRQPEERQATQADVEKVLVPAHLSPPKQKMLALRIDDPTKPPIEIEIEVDKNNRKG